MKVIVRKEISCLKQISNAHRVPLAKKRKASSVTSLWYDKVNSGLDKERSVLRKLDELERITKKYKIDLGISNWRLRFNTGDIISLDQLREAAELTMYSHSSLGSLLKVWTAPDYCKSARFNDNKGYLNP